MAVEQVRSVRKQKPVYKTSTGESVPGVTTVIGLRAKDALVPWAFNLGKQNPGLSSVRDYVDELAEIGSAAHEMISADLRGIAPDLGDYTPNTAKAAMVPFDKYVEWKRGKEIQVIGSEKQYVSDEYRYGGTVDLIAKIDGIVTVLDAKTGKAIYNEMAYQVAAYAKLAEENGGIKIDQLRILQIGRTGAEGFTERIWTDWTLEWEWFKAARALYQVEKDLERRAKNEDRPNSAVISFDQRKAAIAAREVAAQTT